MIEQTFQAAFLKFLQDFGDTHGVNVGLRYPHYIAVVLQAAELNPNDVAVIPVFTPKPQATEEAVPFNKPEEG